MMISKAKLFRVEKKGYLEISDSGVLGLLLFENSNYVMIAEKIGQSWYFSEEIEGIHFWVKEESQRREGKVDEDKF